MDITFPLFSETVYLSQLHKAERHRPLQRVLHESACMDFHLFSCARAGSRDRSEGRRKLRVKKQMGKETRNGVREIHGLFILTENIPTCRDVDGLSFLTSAKTGRWGGRREEGKDERGAHGRLESRRSGAEFLILLNANRESASETTFGARAIVPPGPENICNPFSRANFLLIPILSCQKSTLIPLLSPSPPGPRPGKTSIDVPRAR